MQRLYPSPYDGNQGRLPQPPVAGESGSLAGSGSEWGMAWKENLKKQKLNFFQYW